MEEKSSTSGRLRPPVGHWVIAVLLAAGAAWGIRTWLGHHATQSAQTAVLSWNADAAHHMDPTLADTAEPAVAMAQSILSDSVVADLAHATPLSASKVRVGEFRSRLELRQSSAKLLQVRFLDASPEKAAETANAVAGALVAGTSPAAGEPAASAPPADAAPAPVEKQPAEPVKTTAANPASDAEDALPHALRELQTELSATQQKLNGESAGGTSSYRESNQQQLLTAEVGAALKQVANLRADQTNGPQIEASLQRIRKALLAVWPASRSEADQALRKSADLRGFNAAGVDAGRLRQERAEFAHAVEVVRREQEAVQQLKPVSAPKPPAPAPVASESAASAPAAATPAIAESEIPSRPADEPFRLLRPAGSPARNPLWPAVLAGLCCGTLYLGAAGLRYRHDGEAEEEESEYGDDSEVESGRLITPAKPMRAPDFFGRAEAPAAEPLRSADFFAPAEAPAAELVRPADFLTTDVPVEEPLRQPEVFAAAEAFAAEVIPPAPKIESADPLSESRQEVSSEVIYRGAPAAGDATRRPFVDEAASEEGDGDPWVDNMMRTLSETSIGRMFEKSAAQSRGDSTADAESQERSSHHDRLAG